MRHLLLKKRILKSFFLLFDLALIYFAFILAFKIRFFNEASFFNFLPFFQYNNILFFSILIWFCLCYILDLIHIPRTRKRIQTSFWNYIIYPQFILISILFLFIIFLNYDQIPRLFLFLFIFIQFSFLTISKKIRIKIFQFLRISGLDYINLGLISNDDDINNMGLWLNRETNSGFKFRNLKLKDKYTNSKQNFTNLIKILNHGDYLILNKKHLSKKELIEIKEKAENKGIHIYRTLSSKRYNFIKNRNIRGISTIGPFKLIIFRKLPVKTSINIINKRIFDFIFSFLFLFFIYWWVYLIVSSIIKIQSKGPVLFKQERIGLDGDKFMCYKFRTMHIDITNSKEITKIGDLRIFSFGQFLRKTNIDEFPQFINVFKGDMSVVGPRPHMLSEDNMLADKIEKYRMRRWVKPGITGFAAINGFRGGTESMELMQKRINFDVKYIEKWSFLLDVKICYHTILEMISLKNKGH